MEFIVRKIEHNLSKSGMQDTINLKSASPRRGRSLSKKHKQNYISIKVTEIQEVDTILPSASPSPSPARIEILPATCTAENDAASSIYSRKSFRDYLPKPKTSSKSKKSTKEFMSAMNSYPWISGPPAAASSHTESIKAASISTTSSKKPIKAASKKQSTREFMSAMNSYPWISGPPSSSGLTSSAAASSRRSARKSSAFSFPCIAACV